MKVPNLILMNFFVTVLKLKQSHEGILNDDSYDYIDDLGTEDADTLANGLQSIIKLCGGDCG